MKKFAISIFLASICFAAPSNYVGIGDIKDALYYLIKDYEALKKEVLKKNTTKESILKYKQLQKEIEALKIRIEGLHKKLKKAIFIKNKKKDYLDKYIENYNSNNTEILLKIKDEVK